MRRAYACVYNRTSTRTRKRGREGERVGQKDIDNRAFRSFSFYLSLFYCRPRRLCLASTYQFSITPTFVKLGGKLAAAISASADGRSPIPSHCKDKRERERIYIHVCVRIEGVVLFPCICVGEGIDGWLLKVACRRVGGKVTGMICLVYSDGFGSLGEGEEERGGELMVG